MSITGINESWLPFEILACAVCPYFNDGKCDGSQIDCSEESFTMSDSSVIGCLSPERQIEHFQNLSSLRPPPQTANHNDLVLPNIIFGINDGFKDFPPFSENAFFSISFKTLIDEHGFFKYRSPQNLRRALKISESTKLALICTAVDPVLEKFWGKTYVSDAWKRIADFRFEFSTSLSFSVYDHHPRFDQIFNRERNFVSHDLLLEHGVNSVPFIFFYNDRDFSEVASWLKNRPDIKKVAFHAQQSNDAVSVKNMIRGMKALQCELERDLHFLVVGVFGTVKCGPLKQAFPNLTVVTSAPLYKASCGEKLLPNLETEKMPRSIQNTALALPNINTFRDFYSRI